MLQAFNLEWLSGETDTPHGIDTSSCRIVSDQCRYDVAVRGPYASSADDEYILANWDVLGQAAVDGEVTAARVVAVGRASGRSFLCEDLVGVSCPGKHGHLLVMSWVYCIRRKAYLTPEVNECQ